MRHFSYFIIASVSLAFSACHNSDYDADRYQQIRLAIDGSKNYMNGMSMEDAQKLLSLEGVPWDAGYSSIMLGQLRIYHFRGFSLWLNLEVLPKGILPHETPRQFSFNPNKLRHTGDWWVTSPCPSLYIDNLNDKDQRMTDYWREVNAEMNERSKWVAKPEKLNK